MNRRVVPIELAGWGEAKRTPICKSASCPLKKECASHMTAGDFRSEGGFTPNLLKEQDGSWSCDQRETNSIGMLVWCKPRNRYESYDIYDESQS